MEKDNVESVLDPKPDENQIMQTNNPTSVMRKFDQNPKSAKWNKQKSSAIYGLMGIAVVLAGVGTGYLLSGGLNAKDSSTTGEVVKTDSNGEVQEAGEVKSEDVQEVVGTLTEGGVNGEGTHTLDRGLGENKNVILFST